MKKQVAVAIILSCILAAGIALALSPIAFPSSPTKYNFTLTATGEAYDRKHGGFTARSVDLSTNGLAYGKLSKLLNLFVKSGDSDVSYYGDFVVVRGTGTVIQTCHFIHLIIKVTPKYGGRVAVWDLRGWTGKISDKTIPVLLFSNLIVLPLQGCPKLYRLTLTGTITLT